MTRNGQDTLLKLASLASRTEMARSLPGGLSSLHGDLICIIRHTQTWDHPLLEDVQRGVDAASLAAPLLYTLSTIPRLYPAGPDSARHRLRLLPLRPVRSDAPIFRNLIIAPRWPLSSLTSPTTHFISFTPSGATLDQVKKIVARPSSSR